MENNTKSPVVSSEPGSKEALSAELPRLAYSVAEAAQMLCLSSKSIYRLIDRGLLRCSKALRHKLIPKQELLRFLEETM